MKTIIDLPDGLYRRAKIRAAERGTTLRSLLMESLEVYLLEPAAPGGGSATRPHPHR